MNDFMLTRRQFLTTSCCCLAYFSNARLAIADYDYSNSGCFLSAEEFDSSISNFSSMSSSEALNQLDTRTSDKSLNKAIGTTLTRISGLFDVYPGFGFYEDEEEPNAFATPKTVIQGTKGTVAFGYTLLRNSLRTNPSGISIMGIIAHEFGHIVQYEQGIENRLKKGQSTVRLSELHADFLAGFYAGRRKLNFSDMDTDGLGDTFLGIGDFNYKNPQHHGTPQERIAALTEGFKLGKRMEYNILDVVNKGIEVVSKI